MLAKQRNQGHTPVTPMKPHYPEKQYPDTLTFADALRYNDGDLVRHLLAKGLNPNRRDSNGKPLLLAAVYGKASTNATPELPPHLLAAAGRQGDVHEEIRRLIRCFSPS